MEEGNEKKVVVGFLDELSKEGHHVKRKEIMSSIREQDSEMAH
jgi:hypothetical protein